MNGSWIFILGVLGLATTSCLGFTVQRSNLESFGSRNWSQPIFHLNQRNSVEKIFNDDIENILRDSEMRRFVKVPEKKCSASSENPQRLKRSHDLSNATHRSVIVEKVVNELKDSTIEPVDVELKTSGSTSGALSNELKNSGSPIGMSVKEAPIPDSTIVALSEETNTSEITSVSLPKKKNHSTLTIVPAPKEVKSFKAPIETIRTESKTKLDLPLEKSVVSQTPKNVVLLLIDYSRATLEHYFKFTEIVRKFAVHGFLSNCPKSSFEDPVSAHKFEGVCDCDYSLRANIRSLLYWAQHKEMTIGAVSSINFSIPLPLGYEIPSVQLAKEFEDNGETKKFHQEIPRSNSESNQVWRLIDIEKQSISGKESSPPHSANPGIRTLSKHEQGLNGFDGMSNILDMLSRIRVAFFRILLESLGNMTATEDELNGKRSLPLEASFVEILTDAIREFKMMRNNNGFVLVAAAPRNEWSHAIDVLQHEILTKDTLLVVSGICSPTNDRTPFFAHGPGERLFKDARVISDLPELVKRAMTDGCLEKSCKKQRFDTPVALSSPELSSSPYQLPRKRVGRESRKKIAVNETTPTNITLTKKSVDKQESDMEVKLENGQGTGAAADIRLGFVAKFLGIAMSLFTMLALVSPESWKIRPPTFATLKNMLTHRHFFALL
ncbi:uncharacterized protein [Venturia canescens]|uniref:uncharacterized protein n=1 Tax=Venturia canescens TaxID=32260 RepID=UPI001C9C8A84|nr:uncharacterized protein LOC122406041 [Venturia canescens]